MMFARRWLLHPHSSSSVPEDYWPTSVRIPSLSNFLLGILFPPKMIPPPFVSSLRRIAKKDGEQEKRFKPSRDFFCSEKSPDF